VLDSEERDGAVDADADMASSARSRRTDLDATLLDKW
jgi:hypothetical protein